MVAIMEEINELTHTNGLLTIVSVIVDLVLSLLEISHHTDHPAHQCTCIVPPDKPHVGLFLNHYQASSRYSIQVHDRHYPVGPGNWKDIRLGRRGREREGQVQAWFESCGRGSEESSVGMSCCDLDLKTT
jgi:hypothetical protein